MEPNRFSFQGKLKLLWPSVDSELNHRLDGIFVYARTVACAFYHKINSTIFTSSRPSFKGRFLGISMDIFFEFFLNRQNDEIANRLGFARPVALLIEASYER